MDFAIPPEIEQLCANIHKFMDQHVYPHGAFGRSAGRCRSGGRRIRRRSKRCRRRPRRPATGRSICRRKPAAPAYRSCTTCSSTRSSAAVRLRRWRAARKRPTRATPRSSGASGPTSRRQRWLKPLVNGDIRSCFSMTEPEVAGSDPRLLRTTAKRDGDDYVINGAQVVQQRRARRVVRHRHGDDQPGAGESVPALQPDHRPHRHARLPDRARHPGDGRRTTTITPRSGTRTAACR